MANQSAVEQAILELVNRARLDPAGEAALDGIALNEGVPAGSTISTASKQPLAMNDILVGTAHAHSQDMITNDYFAHNDLSGHDPFFRMDAAGYQGSTEGENIAASGTSGQITQAMELQLHQNLFIDLNYPDRGHRTNLMSPDYQEIGTGVATGVTTAVFGGTFNTAMLTEDFGTPAGAVTQFLTGVAFNDTVTADKFYTIGEGRGNISAAVSGGPSTATGSAGGYSEQVAAGLKTITFSGGDEVTPVVLTATIAAGTNAKIDLMGQSTIRTSVSITDVSGISTIIGLGTFALTLTGAAGAQTISGSFGNDHIDGAGGDDTAVFTGARANYTVQTVGGTTTVTDNVGRDGSDTLTNIEHLKFADQTVNLGGGSTHHPVSNFDGHAFDDVMLQVTATQQLIFANMEAGARTGFGALTSAISGLTVVGHGDINGDGIADVVVQNPTNDAVYAAEQNGSGNGAPTWVALTAGLKGGGFDFHAVGVGDINGDGHADVLLQNEGASGDGSILAVTGQSGGVPTFVSVAPALKGGGIDFQVKGVGDINGDGFADVVLQDAANAPGQVLIRDFHDNTFFTLATNTGGLKVVGVGDVNGDGHADVVLQAAAGGNTYYLDPAGGVNDFKVVAVNIGTTLIARDVADVDNDGFADVLFQVTTNGEVDYRHVGATDVDGFWGAVVGPNGNAFHLV